jgi:phosphoesterase RecJ-like protein
MVYETHPAVKFRLLGRALATLEFDWQGRIAALTVTRKMLDEAGAEWEHTEGFVEYPRSIEGVEVAVFFSEIGAGSSRRACDPRGGSASRRWPGSSGGAVTSTPRPAGSRATRTR